MKGRRVVFWFLSFGEKGRERPRESGSDLGCCYCDVGAKECLWFCVSV